MKPKGFQYFADISSNNQDVSILNYSRAGHVLIGIKATQGDHYINPFHKEWCDIAHDLGLTVLHYHFNEELGASKEVEHFRSVYNKAFRNGDYTCFDFERGQNVTYVEDTFEYYYHHTLRRAALYCDENDYNDKYRYIKYPGSKLWVARYGPEPKIKKWSWQYTDGEIGSEPHYYTGIGKSDGSILSLGPATALLVRKYKTRRRR